MTRKQKQMGLLMIGLFLALLGMVCVYRTVTPKTYQEEQVLLDYEVQARIPYRVKLLPNPLYADQWQEEGRVYAWKLTDYIEISPSVEIVYHQNGLGEGTSPEIQGECQISTVIEGYETSGESRKAVYEQRNLLKELTTNNQSGKMEMTIPFKPNALTIQAERAEQILGTSVPKECYILFQGSFKIQAGGMEEEKEFSLRLGIPVEKGQGLYELSRSEITPVEGRLVKTETKKMPISRGKVILGAVLIILGGGIGFVAWFYVEPADEEELWREHMRKILRQYGSRMVCVKELPDGEGNMLVTQMDGLALIAEELQSPILFCQDKESLPEDGRFVVAGEKGCYQVHFPKPNTPFVVEKSRPMADSISKESDYTENVSNKSKKEEDLI